MSVVEPQVPIDPTPPQEDNVLQSVDTSSSAQELKAPHGKHEVKSSPLGNPAEENTIEQNGHGHGNGAEDPYSEAPLALEDLGSPSTDQRKPEAEENASSAKGKPAMSVKITESKSVGPPTPQVKKVSVVSQHLSFL